MRKPSAICVCYAITSLTPVICSAEVGASLIAARSSDSLVQFSQIFQCVTKPLQYCLADSLQTGRDVVLIRQNNVGVCVARTADSHRYQDEVHDFSATKLLGPEGCQGPFYLGFLGASTTAVHLNLPVSTSAPGLQDLDWKARKLVMNPPDSNYGLAADEPKILATEETTVLIYRLKTNERGPSVVFKRGGSSVVLAGRCTAGHKFFSINKNVYLYYLEQGCDSGKHVVYVYDLSGGKVEQVYRNDKLGT